MDASGEYVPAPGTQPQQPLPIIKTRFPVARIKKIMQADDDIGKVAQATPLVVAKALELFMISLVQESCNQARLRNAKRVSPSHLKQAVLSTEQFDFLAETVGKYPDAVAVSGDKPEPGTGPGRGRRRKVVE
ncbi:DNA polymerase epsilon subunit C [Lipomyces kononenkoae]|uniref:DNA polymerase epsilon subunit C n=1 Tax=Lipomyces kononenkoae TaxID=34357 RepID=A0ACC3SWI1_LIPKO